MDKPIHVLSKDEEKTLEDLITFNKQYEKLFFSDDRNEGFLTLIDDAIEEKLSKIDTFQAFKFLNRIWARSNEVNTSLDVKIITGLDCDLAVNRLSIQLLDLLTNSMEFCDYYEHCGQKLSDFLYSNFFDYIMPNGIKMNYFLMVDNAERFLGLVSSSKDISDTKKLEIIDIYMFLYKDIYEELKIFNITEKNGITLSKRSDVYNSIRINECNILKSEITSAQFYYMVYEMLSITDEEVDNDMLEDFELGKLYLDSLLLPLDSLELNQVLYYYEEYKKLFDLSKTTKSLKLINESINKKRNS